jgi:hypothetical protein
VLHQLNLKSAGTGFNAADLSVPMLSVQLLVYMCAAVVNLLPAMIVRFLVSGEPLYGGGALFGSAFHYATASLFFVTPYRMVTGSAPLASMYAVFMLLAEAVWAALSYAAAYMIVSMPQPEGDASDITVELDDSTLCLAALGEFMNMIRGRHGASSAMEVLWQPVYAYLRNEELMRKLVKTQGLAHDQIVLNAVGSIAFRLLSNGAFHASQGVLTPEGEYVKKVWMSAGNELVRRSYSGPDDMNSGTLRMEAAVEAAGGGG